MEFKKYLKDNYKSIILLALPFLLMDTVLRLIAIRINYFRFEMLVPSIIFTCIWVLLIAGITINLKGKLGKVFYCMCFAVFFVMFFVHMVYFLYTGFFFRFNLLLLANEGSSYIKDTVLNTSPAVFVASIAILIVMVLVTVKHKSAGTTDKKRILIVLCGFVVLHFITPMLMGKVNDSLQWDNWRNPRNVYDSFNDANKNIKICGLYEYTFRDMYVTFLKPKEKENPEELEYLNKAYSTQTKHNVNEYTGIFKDKNVIFLQLEGLDSWLLNETDTPTLYGLLDNSIIFDNHFSYYNGGGSTFNSELAVNTGLITPVSYTKNAYTFSTNLYKTSLPLMFKNAGYTANAFHMNTGEYYSREINYLNWGYDAYYGLMDDPSYTDKRYELDRELILNKSFYETMFRQKGPFMNYVITYTPHTPFNLDSSVGKQLSQHIYGEKEIPELNEEEVARLFAAETDYCVKLLFDALEENDLLDDTVIVAYADHYLYTLNDKSILEKYKETDNNLINRTPFFIWSKDMEQVRIDKVNSQIDILPTVLNMFGFQYTEEDYIGRDIMDKEYGGYTFFSDYSWYDGDIYVENGRVVDGKSKEEGYVKNINETINHLIQKNDLTLKYDYFRKKK